MYTPHFEDILTNATDIILLRPLTLLITEITPAPFAY